MGDQHHDDSAIVKIRQHAPDPSRTAGRTGFLGSNVANLNADLAKLLRFVVRGGGPPRDRPSTSSQAPRRSEDKPIRGTATSKRNADLASDYDNDERHIHSTDEEEVWVAALEAAPNHASCPTPDSSGPRSRRPDPAATPSCTVTAAEAARDADAFIATILNND